MIELSSMRELALDESVEEDGPYKMRRPSAQDVNLQTTSVTAINLLNAIIGSAVLSLPFAINQGGALILLLILPVSFFMGLTLYITGVLLAHIDASAEQEGIPRINRDWALLAFKAFGAPGKWIMSLLFTTDCCFCMVTYIITAADNIHVVVPQLDMQSLLFFMGLGYFVLLFVPLHYFSVFSFLGIVSQVLVFLALLVTGIEMEIRSSAAHDYIFFRPSGAVSSVGLILFLFNAHGPAPMIYQSMRYRDQWPNAVTYAVSGSALFYSLVGGFGYLFFSSRSKQVVTANLGVDFSSVVLSGPLPESVNAAMGPFCAMCVALKLVTSYPVYAMPVILLIEGASEVKQIHRSIVVRFCCAACSTFIAWLLVEKLVLCAELGGSLIHSFTTVIMPCIFFLWLLGTNFSCLTKSCLLIAVVMFVGLMTLSVGYTVRHMMGGVLCRKCMMCSAHHGST